MGTEYFLTDETNRALFELGKALHVQPLRLYETIRTRHPMTLEELDASFDAPRNFTPALHRFLERANWDVGLIDDSTNTLFELVRERLYTTSGSVYYGDARLCPCCKRSEEHTGALEDHLLSCIHVPEEMDIRNGMGVTIHELPTTRSKGSIYTIPHYASIYANAFASFYVEKEAAPYFTLERVTRRDGAMELFYKRLRPGLDRSFFVAVFAPVRASDRKDFEVFYDLFLESFGEDWRSKFVAFPANYRQIPE